MFCLPVLILPFLIYLRAVTPLASTIPVITATTGNIQALNVGNALQRRQRQAPSTWAAIAFKMLARRSLRPMRQPRDMSTTPVASINRELNQAFKKIDHNSQEPIAIAMAIWQLPSDRMSPLATMSGFTVESRRWRFRERSACRMSPLMAASGSGSKKCGSTRRTCRLSGHLLRRCCAICSGNPLRWRSRCLPVDRRRTYSRRRQNSDSAHARTGPTAASPKFSVPPPETLLLLVRTTMIGIDQANKTNNYSVLRGNWAARAEGIQYHAVGTNEHSSTTDEQVDLAPAACADADAHRAAEYLWKGLLILKGCLTRPLRILFTFVYQKEHADWKPFGLSVGMMPAQKSPNLASHKNPGKRLVGNLSRSSRPSVELKMAAFGAKYVVIGAVREVWLTSRLS